MNLLAHLALTPATPEGWLGGVLPDLARVRKLDGLPAGVAEAVGLHRAVDVWTDTHPAFARSKRRIFGDLGRYSGIVVDVLYDYCLVQTWGDWHGETGDGAGYATEDALIEAVYDGCVPLAEARPAWLSERTAGVLARLRSDDWLRCYGTLDGLRLTFDRMSARFEARFERAVDLSPAVDALIRERVGLSADFADLYPVLRSRSAAWLGTTGGRSAGAPVADQEN